MDATSSRSSALNCFRRHPRIRVPTPFVCALSRRVISRRWFTRTNVDLGVVYDLSLRGVRVSTEATIKPGDEVAVSLRLPKQIISAEIAIATVQWTKDKFFGLAFRKLSPGTESRLQKFLALATRISFASEYASLKR
jgi:hypothetical protein